MASQFVEKAVYKFPLTVSSTFTFTATEVDITADTVRVPNHTFKTGDACGLSTTGAVPTGLTALSVAYYIIVVDGSTIGFASSRANAVAGTKINLTAVGSGTTTIHKNGFGDVILGVLPDGFIITNAFIDVITTFASPTGVDNATIALGAVANGDLVAAIAISDASNVWDAGIRGTLVTAPNMGADAAHDSALETIALFAATKLKTTADRAILANIAVDTLSAGDLDLYIEGYQGR